MDRGKLFKEIALAGLMAVGIMLMQLILLESPWSRDPMFYMQKANWLDSVHEGGPVLALDHRSLRVGLIGMLVVMKSIFGYSEAMYYSVGLVAMGLLSSSTYALARLLLPRIPSVFAGVLVAANPLILARSSHPFPDLPAAALFTTGIGLLLWSGREAVPARVSGLMVLTAGATFGAAFAFRESIVLLAPVVLVAMWVIRIGRRDAVLLGMGAMAILVFELAAMQQWAGNALARLEVVLGRGSEGELAGAAIDKAAQTAEFQGTYTQSAVAFVRHLYRSSRWALVFLIAPIGAAVGWLVSRRTAWLVIGSWLLTIWSLHLLIGPMRTGAGGFVFRLLQIRYWYPVFPALAIGLVGVFYWGMLWLMSATRTGGGRVGSIAAATTAVAGAIIGVGLMSTAVQGPGMFVNGNDHMREFRAWVQEFGDEWTALKSPTLSRRIVAMYTVTSLGVPVWDGSVQRLVNDVGDSMIVLSVEERNPGFATVDGEEVPLTAPPHSWGLEFVSEAARLIVLDPSAGVNHADGLADWDLGSPNGLALENGQTSGPLQFEGSLDPDAYRRMKVSYRSSGTAPRVWCRVASGTGIESLEALAFGGGIDHGTGVLVRDYYCPPAGGEGTDVSAIVVANRGEEEIILESVLSIPASH